MYILYIYIFEFYIYLRLLRVLPFVFLLFLLIVFLLPPDMVHTSQISSDDNLPDGDLSDGFTLFVPVRFLLLFLTFGNNELYIHLLSCMFDLLQFTTKFGSVV